MNTAIKAFTSVEEVASQVNYNPLISQLLVTNANELNIILQDSLSRVSNASLSFDDLAELNKDIEDVRYILRTRLRLTRNFLSEKEPDATQQKLEFKEEEEKDNVRVMKPIHIAEPIIQTVEQKAAVEKQPFVKRDTNLEDIKTRYSIHPELDITLIDSATSLKLLEEKLRSYNGKVANEVLLDLYTDFISIKSYPETTPTDTYTPRMLDSVGGLHGRFKGMVTNFKSVSPKESKKQKPNRVKRAEAIAQIKDFVVQNKIEEAFDYGTLQFRTLCVLRDDKDVTVPALSKKDYLELFQTIVPAYVPVEKVVEVKPSELLNKTEETAPVVTETVDVSEELSKEFGYVIEQTNYKNVLDILQYKAIEANLGNVEKNHAVMSEFATKYLVTQGVFDTDSSGSQIIQKFTQEQCDKILNSIYASVGVEWITRPDVHQLLNSVKEELTNQPQGQKIPALKKILEAKGIVNNITTVKKIYNAAKALIVATSEKIDKKVEQVTDPTKEIVINATTPVTEPSNALVFTRSSVRSSDPELWTKFENATNIQQLHKACLEVLDSHEWVTSKNLAIDLVEAKKIKSTEKWLDSEGKINPTKIDNWFNNNVIVAAKKAAEKQARIEANASFEAEKPSESPLSEPSSTGTTEKDSEQNTDGENVEIAIPQFKTKKELDAHLISNLGTDHEKVFVEVILSFPPYLKHDEKWANQYMVGIRKQASKLAKTAKKLQTT